jgi:hypothetical protein
VTGTVVGGMSDEISTEVRHDELPEELDVTVTRPWKVPTTDKRRISAVCYLVMAALCVAGFVWTANEGILAAGVFLAAVGAHHWRTGWRHNLDETAALAASATAVGFPVGHASAQLAWRGFLSRPVWRVLLYSADEPPSQRGLVELDAIDGTVIGQYTEDNPEDWAAYGFGEPASPSGASA